MPVRRKSFPAGRWCGAGASGGLRWRRSLLFSAARRGCGGAGGMAEWLKAHAWKACVRESVPWVRIPLPPPDYLSMPLFIKSFLSLFEIRSQILPQIAT
jgi:hypothetical protein